jgi:methylated-DNA-[protein]-cysteine S-methyltransferase
VTRRGRLFELVESPLGPILLSADSSGRLAGARIGSVPEALEPAGHDEDDAGHGGRRVLRDAAAQLGEYFAGRRRSFDLPLALEGPPFHQEVWAQLQQVPFGITVSYGQLAQRLGRPGSARAVGHANARNPIAVIVPCHRVIGSSGQLTGYGGGLAAKQHLLDLEARGARSPHDAPRAASARGASRRPG